MNNFSIGEMSKLTNLSIQTLRYYDKIGLLKPKIVNKNSRYRYYSVDQFLQIDLIKYYKNAGLSLEEIRKIIGTYTSIEEKLHIIDIQQESLENKLQELKLIKKHMDFIKNKMSSIIEYELDKIFIKYNKKREYISYDYIARTNEELEMNYRKVILDVERNRGLLDYELACSVAYDSSKEKITYKNIMLNISDNILKHNGKVTTLPEGEYITIYFKGGSFKNKEYYK